MLPYAAWKFFHHGTHSLGRSAKGTWKSSGGQLQETPNVHKESHKQSELLHVPTLSQVSRGIEILHQATLEPTDAHSEVVHSC